ncbi:MAG: hypothetical protein DRP66_10555 [Planctomycetota bacterium]|nr:MAG: hypothetical protein DRP66_10555 [Planctomycetota bacterium]
MDTFLLMLAVLTLIAAGAVFLTTGGARIINLLALVVWAVSYADNARFWKIPLRHGIALPLGAVLLIYAITNAVYQTLRNGGIDWRDTHYRLEDLKANRI